MASSQPNTTLYLNNLNDQVNKDELRSQLYALFTTYGKLIDVVASKTAKMRGQAFLVFTDLAAATSALRACDGMMFYDKPMRIQYAKSKSHATLRREDPNFVPPTSAHGQSVSNAQQLSTQKRLRDSDEMDVDARSQKRERAAEDEEEEMEIDDEEDVGPRLQCYVLSFLRAIVAKPPSEGNPTSRLLCTNLPQEVTDGVLSVLFQQYQGFQSTHVAQSPTPNAAGEKVKSAQVIFDIPERASVAKDALDGFAIKKGWPMSVVYA
ncbi:RNA-binding domain-containing protein [Auriscalpium vulgare]|uniref:RNA-binding domain-containing protein n=1 Tax=Auriscalpium vulgare TaxID=40419 RepID=A0ACB8RCI6_9AGAM|nr:RNA-binding domain-containing protein [Auriscalpium vulgare]